MRHLDARALDGRLVIRRWLIAAGVVLACSAEPAEDEPPCNLEPEATCYGYAQAYCQCEQWTDAAACEQASCIWWTNSVGTELCRSWCDLYE